MVSILDHFEQSVKDLQRTCFCRGKSHTRLIPICNSGLIGLYSYSLSTKRGENLINHALGFSIVYVFTISFVS